MDINNISQEEFEKIEAYINGQLSNEDLTIFETKLKEDDDFSTLVADVKIFLTGIETQALKEELENFHEDMTQTNKPKTNQPKIRTLNWKRLSIAAILVIGLGSFWLMRGNSNERLYANYFSPDPGLPTTMSSTNKYSFYEAMVSYKQGNYKAALSTWYKQLKTKASNDTLNYFIGSALLADKQVNAAIPYLNTVTKLNDTTFKKEAYFYLGLAHLKSNNIEAAINALKQSDLPQSKDLLDKLD